MPKVVGFDPKILWTSVNASSWLSVLNHFAPGSRWTHASPTSLKGRCPFHVETSPSFTVYLDRGYAKCFGGSCQYISSDPLRFLAKLAHAPPEQVLTSIVHQRFGIKITGKDKERVKEAERLMKLRESLAAVFNHVLCEAINNPAQKEYSYIQPLVTWLTSRGVPLNLVERLPIGTMPTKSHIYEHIDPEFRSSFEKYFEKTNLIGLDPDQIFFFTGSLSLHYQPAPRFAGRIKLRRPEDAKSMLWLGSLEEPQGYFGLDLYSSCIGRETNAHLVEGEFDVLMPYLEELKQSSVPSTVFVGCSGGAIGDISTLKDLGFRSATVVGDHDEGGEGFANMALENAEKFTLRVFDWKRTEFAGAHGADPASIVKDGNFTQFLEALIEPNNLVQRHLWVAAQIEAELAGADPNDLDLQKQVLSRYARCVHDPTDRSVVGEILQKKGLLSDGVIQTLLRGAANDEEYVVAIKKALEQEIVPQYIDTSSKSKIVTCYSRLRKTSFEFPAVNAREMVASLSPALEMSIYEWCAARIGEPEWLMWRMVRNQLVARTFNERNDFVLKLFEAAVSRIYPRLPTLASLEDRRQGIHFIDAASRGWDHDPSTRYRLFVVNGTQVFLGYLDPTRPRVTWEPLDVPMHETLILKTAPPPWAPGLSVTELNRALSITPEAIYEDISRAIGLGWRFSLTDPEEQALEVQYLSALVLYSQIAAVFDDWMMQTFIHAERESGKSALLSMFCANDDQSVLSLVECSNVWSEWTAAGATQSHEGCSMLLCLDEFESPSQSDHDEMRKKQVKKLLLMFRQNVVADVRSVRGTPTGGARSSKFRSPVLAAGVHAFNQSEVDFSRWNYIRGFHDPDRQESPQQRILQHFSIEDIDRLRRKITIMVLQQAAKMREHYKWCIDEYTPRKDFPRGTNSRLLQMILPIAAVLKWTGQDEEKFIYDYLRLKIRTRRAYYTTGTDTILQDLLSIGRVQIADDPQRPATPGSLLADANRRDQLNTSYCGVYYIPQCQIVAIHCRQALGKLLRFHKAYRTHTDEQAIRKELMQNPLALTEADMKELNIADYLRVYTGMRKLPYRDIVAFPLDAIIFTGGIPAAGQPGAEEPLPED